MTASPDHEYEHLEWREIRASALLPGDRLRATDGDKIRAVTGTKILLSRRQIRVGLARLGECVYFDCDERILVQRWLPGP